MFDITIKILFVKILIFYNIFNYFNILILKISFNINLILILNKNY